MTPPMLYKSLCNKKHLPNDSNGLQCRAQTNMQDNRRQCSWALSWDSYRAWVCEAVQTIAREQTSVGGRNCGQPSTRPPFFRQAVHIMLHLGLSPLFICTTGRPVPRQSGHLQECSFPLWRPGLVMPRPCHIDCSLGQGRNSERSRKVKESKNTFFLRNM